MSTNKYTEVKDSDNHTVYDTGANRDNSLGMKNNRHTSGHLIRNFSLLPLDICKNISRSCCPMPATRSR
jgi:hypothetical protein